MEEEFEMMCETTVRKIFQCNANDDPLGRLSNADNWTILPDEDFSKIHMAQTWSVIARLKGEYLFNVKGREELLEQVKDMEDQLLETYENKKIKKIMREVIKIVNNLGIREFPHLNYRATNDQKL